MRYYIFNWKGMEYKFDTNKELEVFLEVNEVINQMKKGGKSLTVCYNYKPNRVCEIKIIKSFC